MCGVCSIPPRETIWFACLLAGLQGFLSLFWEGHKQSWSEFKKLEHWGLHPGDISHFC